MKSLVSKSLFLGAVALAAVGCGGGADGTWEADGIGCGDFELVIDGEEVTMDAPFPDTAGGCSDCEFDGTWTDEGDDKYEFDLESDDCNLEFGGECTLNDNGDNLDCELDAGGEIEFDLVE